MLSSYLLRLRARPAVSIACALIAGCSGSSGDGGLQTGFLVDSPIAGIRYQTASYQGITGTNGSFQYAPGETVTFTLGATQLGSVAGQLRVTPFDLVAGAEPLSTSGTITAALADGSSPYARAINITRLLQSLDRDGDPDNGIEVTPEAEQLLRTTQLDFAQDADAFTHDSAVTNLMESLNLARAFSDSQERTLYTPERTLNHLHASLDLALTDDNGKPLSQEVYREEDTNMDGVIDRNFHRRFDAAGNLVYEDMGDPNGPWKQHNYEYDAAGNLRRHEEIHVGSASQGGALFTYDASGNLVQTNAFGPSTGQALYTFNTAGQLTRAEGTDDIQTATHNELGQLVRVTYDLNKDGIDWAYDFIYDEQGRRIQETNDDEANGSADEYIYYHYNGSGRMTVMEYDRNADRVIDSRVTITYNGDGKEIERAFWPSLFSKTATYDNQGNLIRLESRQNGVLTESTDYRYNSKGQLAGYDRWTPSGPNYDHSRHYTYDEQGHRIRQDLDEDGDGITDHIDHYGYDAAGNRTLIQEDHFADGVIDRETRSRWEPRLRTDITAEIVYDSALIEDYYYTALIGRHWYHLRLPPEPSPE